MNTIWKRMLLLGALACLTGCVQGPIRYKTLGYHRYATVEMTRGARASLKPLAATGGLLTDVALTGLDTLAVPVAAVPVTVAKLGERPKPASAKGVAARTVTYPFVFLGNYPVSLFRVSFGNLARYEELFGVQSLLYVDNINAYLGERRAFFLEKSRTRPQVEAIEIQDNNLGVIMKGTGIKPEEARRLGVELAREYVNRTGVPSARCKVFFNQNESVEVAYGNRSL